MGGRDTTNARKTGSGPCRQADRPAQASPYTIAAELGHLPASQVPAIPPKWLDLVRGDVLTESPDVSRRRRQGSCESGDAAVNNFITVAMTTRGGVWTVAAAVAGTSAGQQPRVHPMPRMSAA